MLDFAIEEKNLTYTFLAMRNDFVQSFISQNLSQPFCRQAKFLIQHTHHL